MSALVVSGSATRIAPTRNSINSFKTFYVQLIKRPGHGFNLTTKPQLKSQRRSGLSVVRAFAGIESLTPILPSLISGMALGTLAVSKMVVSGRILGISGMVKGILRGDGTLWRFLFLAGLVGGGFYLANYFPTAFEALPVAISTQRMIGAGLLVGMGTSIGGGCTSGHGICGNARLSPRSFVSTLTFMAAGAVATLALRTTTLFAIPSGIVPLAAPAPELLALSKTVLAASVALLAIVSIAAKVFIKRQSFGECSIREEPGAIWLDRFTNLAFGFLFAVALGSSGMLKPSKVSGFLSVMAGSFDPSLMFVMGGALLVSLPGFQLITRGNFLRAPLCDDEFFLPAAKKIDWKLMIGSALFGVGWAAAGICPGPGLVSLATVKVPIAQFVGAMVAGMLIAQRLEDAADRMVVA